MTCLPTCTTATHGSCCPHAPRCDDCGVALGSAYYLECEPNLVTPRKVCIACNAMKNPVSGISEFDDWSKR